MNMEFGDKRNIPDAERQAFIKALTACYSGVGPIRAAFDPVEPGLIDRYYRRKKRYPDEMAEIERETEAKALQERSIHQLAFEARQERGSHILREKAKEGLLRTLPRLLSIAEGSTYEVEVLEYNRAAGESDTRRKTVIIYPQDQIAAFKVLLDVARHGILPEKPRSSPSSRTQDTKDRGTLKSFLGASADFTSVSVATPDGRTFTATVDNPDGFFTDADDGADCDKALVVSDSPGEEL